MKRLPLLLALLSLACSERSPRTDALVDSAGVEIVTNSPPYPILELAETPNARIGTVDGSSDYQFTSVLYAAGLSDGGLVVVDRRSNDVRWYERDGSFRFRAGGRGEGPGEFRGMAAGILLSGDTLVLYDARNQRLTWFGPQGSFVRTRRLEVTSAFDVDLGDLGGGQVVLIENRAAHNFGGAEFNYARDTLVVLVPSTAGESVDTISKLAGREAATWVNYVDGRPTATRQMDLPFGEIALAQVVRDRLVVAPPGESKLAFYSPGGALTRIALRADIQPVEASATLQARYVEGAVEQAAEDGRPTEMIREGLEARFALLPKGRVVPTFDRMLVEGERNQIWLREFMPPWVEGDASRWTVYGREGRVEAQVDVPAGFRPTHIYGDELVGVEADELGVEYVARYVLSPSERTTPQRPPPPS